MNKSKLKEIYTQGKYLYVINHFVRKDPNLYVLLIKEKYSQELKKLKSKYDINDYDASDDILKYLIKNKIEEEKINQLKRFLIELNNNNIIMLEMMMKNLTKRQYFFESEEKLALWLINHEDN